MFNHPSVLFVLQTFLVPHQPLPAEMASAFPVDGDAISILTALMVVMNSTVPQMSPLHALLLCLPVITTSAFPEFGYVIQTMTVRTDQMKRTAVSIRTGEYFDFIFSMNLLFHPYNERLYIPTMTYLSYLILYIYIKQG